MESGRTDKNLCRCFGAPACRVFPDHLISLTNILMHSCTTTWHAHTMALLTWVQSAGETVRTARSVRGNTDTRAEPNGRRWPRLRLLPGRLTAPGNRVARGGTQSVSHLPHSYQRSTWSLHTLIFCTSVRWVLCILWFLLAGLALQVDSPSSVSSLRTSGRSPTSGWSSLRTPG